MNLRKLFGKDAERVVALCTKMYDCKTDGFIHLKSHDAHFTQLCGVAKFHHVRVDWCCNGSAAIQPDKWIIYRNGIRYLLSIDALRYDGVYARIKKI